ncbi:hypothetical protein AX774_g1722 [Zancudomyces culisetae]|uniref:Uncharacterized protein n=1 Tax=Zancudomyces culisetae TaxID=1213189 RepID=A0A1R1PUX4_ZANCU|nr:hypothetical protein AX774_g1722 [Zancudomyces culisetae]|eukprot:OMH84747.1 hypothetical protein AX774_g1722 [Zancudomyces culisetae]
MRSSVLSYQVLYGHSVCPLLLHWMIRGTDHPVADAMSDVAGLATLLSRVSHGIHLSLNHSFKKREWIT